MKSVIVSQETAPSKPLYPKLWKRTLRTGTLVYMEMREYAICIQDDTGNGRLGYVIEGEYAKDWTDWEQVTGPITIQFTP